jgi:hypothetical protein
LLLDWKYGNYGQAIVSMQRQSSRTVIKANDGLLTYRETLPNVASHNNH